MSTFEKLLEHQKALTDFHADLQRVRWDLFQGNSDFVHHDYAKQRPALIEEGEKLLLDIEPDLLPLLSNHVSACTCAIQGLDKKYKQ